MFSAGQVPLDINSSLWCVQCRRFHWTLIDPSGVFIKGVPLDINSSVQGFHWTLIVPSDVIRTGVPLDINSSLWCVQYRVPLDINSSL